LPITLAATVGGVDVVVNQHQCHGQGPPDQRPGRAGPETTTPQIGAPFG